MSKIEEVVDELESMMSSRENVMGQMERMGRHGKGELFILKYMNDKNAAVTPSEISDAMHTSTARISAALGSLEKKGQIKREIDTANRRNILVTITEDGCRRIRSDMEKMRGQMIAVFTEMGEHDAAEFVRLIKLFFKLTHKVFANGTTTK